MKRLTEFDIAKALCIILVVMGHNIPDGLPIWWQATHDIIYTFHMPLFMFASGFIYIAFKENEPYLHFLQKKVLRLMVPYLTTSFIVITLKLLLQGSGSVDNQVTVATYLRMFYLPEAGYFLWFIWALWWMFCITPTFKSKQSRLVLFLMAAILHYMPHNWITTAFCLQQTSKFYIWFMLGVICYDWSEQLSFIKRVPASAVLCTFIGLQIAYISQFGGRGILRVVLPYISIGFIMTISNLIAKKEHPKMLMIISGSSYIIYLLHTTFMAPLRAVIMKLPFYDNENDLMFAGMVLIVCSAGVVLPILFHRYCLSKTKITRFLFGLK